MSLEIIGKITNMSAGSKGAILEIAEHRGMFKSTGKITVNLDKQAYFDLVNNTKKKGSTALGGKTIYIIVK